MKMPQSDPRILKLIGLIFLVIGVGLVAMALYLTVNSLSFLKGSVKTSGKVTALVTVISEQNDANDRTSLTTYAPVFTFTTADGETVAVTSKVSATPPDFTVGETVSVRYHPDRPAEARISTTGQLWGLPLIVGSLGVGLLAVALFMISKLL